MVDRLSVLDASFLRLEGSTTPMHLGGVNVFAPGLTFAHVAEVLEARLGAVPHARKRVATVPLAGGRPVWVDDVQFDLSYHLRHSALPAPGDAEQLAEMTSRLISRPLDRSRPLWELYVIEGLEGGRTALLRKMHLAIAGTGADPFSVMLDMDASSTSGSDIAAETPVAAVARWEPEEPPPPVALVVDAARERAEQAATVGRELVRTVRSPARLARNAAALAGTAVDVALRVARTAPPSPLNTRLSPHRRFATVRIALDDLRRVRRAFGGTINDVVLAITADAVGRLLRWRGHDTKDVDLRVMVPVRVHEGGEDDVVLPTAVGEGVVGVLAALPVLQMDPVARLYRVRGETAHLTDSRRAVAATSLVRLAGYGPPQLHALAARLVSGEHRYNVALSNAPGPQEPRYLAGVELVAPYNFIPLAGDSALSVAVTSYAGGVFFGLLGDRDALSDIDVLAESIVEALDDLLAAAGATAR